MIPRRGNMGPELAHTSPGEYDADFVGESPQDIALQLVDGHPTHCVTNVTGEGGDAALATF